MAYDEVLAARIRALLREVPAVREQRMFGGLGFMVDGAMAVAANSQGALMVRVDPAEGSTLADDEHVRPMLMRGRPMAGWLQVDLEALAGEDELRAWVDRGVAYARSLPSR